MIISVSMVRNDWLINIVFILHKTCWCERAVFHSLCFSNHCICFSSHQLDPAMLHHLLHSSQLGPMLHSAGPPLRHTVSLWHTVLQTSHLSSLDLLGQEVRTGLLFKMSKCLIFPLSTKYCDIFFWKFLLVSAWCHSFELDKLKHAKSAGH